MYTLFRFEVEERLRKIGYTKLCNISIKIL